MTQANVLQELEWRGFVQQATPGLAAHFAKGPVTTYCGFDPTVRSLQVGNLMPLMLLANLQRHGHRPIVLMGGGTGLIGDPSGKSAERPLLSREEIRENVRRIRDQSARFLEFGTGPTAAFLLENAEVHGLVAPLVTRASGQKFGKTESGAVYLDPEMTSPYKFYQFWINVDDRDVVNYLKLFTLKTRGEIDDLAAQQKRHPAVRPAQRALAADVTTRVHGADILQSVQAAYAILFGDEQAEVHPQVFDILASEIPTVVVEGDSDSLTLVDLVARAGLAKSKSEARRSIEQGGIYVNQQRIDDVARTIGSGDWIGGRNLLLRKGRKDYALLRRER